MPRVAVRRSATYLIQFYRQQTMKIIGIIGGIGSGKSTVAELFRQAGAKVIAADDIGHQVLLLPNVKDVLRERWGSAIFDNDEINRKKLATVVFADEKELAFLKSLTHPLIAEEAERQRKEHEQSGVPLCLLDAPLLLESGWEHLVDVIVFMSTPAEMRWERVKSRGWSETEWRQREAMQLSVEEKSRRANFVLNNSSDVGSLQTQVEALVRDIVQH